MQPEPILKICQCVINRLLGESVSGPFSRPVNPQLDGCLDYFHIIQTPMDLGTIQLRIEKQYYAQSWHTFTQDVHQVFQNCRLYNPPATIIGQNGAFLEQLFQIMKSEVEKSGFISDVSPISNPVDPAPEALVSAVDPKTVPNSTRDDDREDKNYPEEIPRTTHVIDNPHVHATERDLSSSSSDGYSSHTSSSSDDGSLI